MRTFKAKYYYKHSLSYFISFEFKAMNMGRAEVIAWDLGYSYIPEGSGKHWNKFDAVYVDEIK